MHSPAIALIATVLAVTLSGCGSYAFTLNEQSVYTPPPLFNAYDISDSNLHNCVQQTIADRRIRDAGAVTLLECTYGGIETLEGLEVFAGLKQLNLAHNLLDKIDPLLQLPALERVKLTGNPKLECTDLSTLTERGVIVDKPDHCS